MVVSQVIWIHKFEFSGRRSFIILDDVAMTSFYCDIT